MRIDSGGKEATRQSGLPGAVSRLIDSVGTGEFPDQLLGSMRDLWGMKFVAVYAFTSDHDTRTRLLLGASQDRRPLVQTNGGEYSLRYAHKDPARLAVLRTARGCDEPVSTCVSREELDEPGHRHLLEQERVIDRFACFFGDSARGWLSLHAMRDQDFGPISEREFSELREFSTVFRSLVSRHIDLDPGGDAHERIRRGLRSMDARLSVREIDVCALLLSGRSFAGISGDLGLRLSSVQTYRKRAYQKLGVRDMREIFARLLGMH